MSEVTVTSLGNYRNIVRISEQITKPNKQRKEATFAER